MHGDSETHRDIRGVLTYHHFLSRTRYLGFSPFQTLQIETTPTLCPYLGEGATLKDEVTRYHLFCRSVTWSLEIKDNVITLTKTVKVLSSLVLLNLDYKCFDIKSFRNRHSSVWMCLISLTIREMKSQ